MIVCATCNKHFEPLFDEHYQQACGCSAEIYSKDGVLFMQGFYGSAVIDMEKYTLKNNSDFKIGNICDECVINLLDKNYAIKVENGVW